MPPHISSRTLYFGIFATLLALTALTTGVAFVNLGVFSFAVAMIIALAKATLVVLYFMHVRYSSRLTWAVIGTGVFFLLLLFGLTLSDYLTRGWSTVV